MSPTPVRSLAEIALRVDDLDSMQRFYADVVGLSLLKRFEHSAFFGIADGFENHTEVLALFDRSAEAGYSGLDPARTTIDHIAFSISLADFAAEKERLEQLGLQVDTAEHAWIHWRSLYITDPEGNRVEFVCYDPSVGREPQDQQVVVPSPHSARQHWDAAFEKMAEEGDDQLLDGDILIAEAWDD